MSLQVKLQTCYMYHRLRQGLYMSKLERLFNRVFVSVVFLLTGTRLLVGRTLPAAEPGPKPPSAKIFVLTEAAWLELRTGGDGSGQEAKSSDEKKEQSKSDEKSADKKEPSKSADESKEQSKAKDCDKGSKSGDDKNKDASKSGACEAGGGDGDTGGSGG